MLGQRSVSGALSATFQFAAKARVSSACPATLSVSSGGWPRRQLHSGGERNRAAANYSFHRSALRQDAITLVSKQKTQNKFSLPVPCVPRSLLHISSSFKQPCRISWSRFNSKRSPMISCSPEQALILFNLKRSHWLPIPIALNRSQFQRLSKLRSRQGIRALSSSPDGKKSSGTDASIAPAKLSTGAWLKKKWEVVKHEAHHYWVGTKLLGTEIMICVRILRQACTRSSARDTFKSMHSDCKAAKAG
jgi:hypothetical protein